MYVYSAPAPLGYLLFNLDIEGLLMTCVFTGTLPVGSLRSPERFKTAFDAYFSRRESISPRLVSDHLVGTVFQRAVWKVIAGVPTGETITYTELALRAGKS